MEMRQWALQVLAREGLGQWTVRPGEAYCWLQERAITFDFDRNTGNWALFLHEVAHALYPQPEGPRQNHYHGGQWAAKFGELVNRYMTPKV
jgi:hypothetical protein